MSAGAWAAESDFRSRKTGKVKRKVSEPNEYGHGLGTKSNVEALRKRRVQMVKTGRVVCETSKGDDSDRCLLIEERRVGIRRRQRVRLIKAVS